jgi:hypothetical protein
VKEYFEEMEDEPDDEPREKFTTFNSIAFNYQHAATKQELVNTLPSKPILDRLVSRYFNCNSPLISLAHKPTFEKEYHTFWLDPMNAPVSYIGLIYAIMAIGSFAILGANEQHPDTRGLPLEMIHTYRGSCVQALILSNYIKPGPYTMETLFLHVEGEFMLSKDGQIVPYLMIGNMVRLSLRLGLHRDPLKLGSNFTPFHGEMRRRLWHNVAQIDMLASFHIGLPGMVGSIESDTEYPRNLRDEDFNEDSISLPPSRPSSELTPISYQIYKSILCHECAKVVNLANSLRVWPYEHVLELDELLRIAFEKVPSFYRFGFTGISLLESPGIVIKQFSLFLLYHKARCMLHRKYFTLPDFDQKYVHSKKEALDAAMQLLWGQSMTYESAIRPGGPLANDKWFLSTLATHDFLLASMIVFIKVMQVIQSQEKQNDVPCMVAALERSYHAWSNTNEPSAKKARNVVRVMLEKIRVALATPNASEEFHKGNDARIYESISSLSVQGKFQIIHDVWTVPGACNQRKTPLNTSLGCFVMIDLSNLSALAVASK